MKAIIYTGVETLDFREAPDPSPAPGDELVRIDRVGICGSDMHAYLGHDIRRPAPLILGHEPAGIVTGGPRDGARVAVNPLVTCGACPACKAGRENICPTRQIISMPPREGAFAEWLAIPSRNLVPIIDSLPFGKAALAEPLAVCWHAVRLALGQPDLNPETALVIGGGAIGLGSSLCLRAQSGLAAAILEPNDTRRVYLRDRCGEDAVRPDELGPDRLFDLVIDAVGYRATRETASARVRPGGMIVHIGLGEDRGGLDVRRMTLQEITFTGTYAYTARDFRNTVAAMEEGRLGPLDWTEERPLSDGARAFADIRAGRTPAPKIVLVPGT